MTWGRKPPEDLPPAVNIWDAATGQEILTLRGHMDVVTSVAVSADGKHIASGSLDGTVRVWDASPKAP